MKINIIDDYIQNRITKLTDSLSKKSKKYEHNRIEMTELGKKIKELQTSVDEGFEMFSPISATDASFNNQEVKNLKMKIYLIIEDNKLLEGEIKEISDELKILNTITNKDISNNVSRETSNDKLDMLDVEPSVNKNDSEKYPNISNNEIEKNITDMKDLVKSLKLCIDLCDLDIHRVKLELNNIIDRMNKS